jgi:type VI secretion system secreted protein VgrG
VQRLLREEGLFCWWEHTGNAADDSLGAHTLVIADHNGAIETNTQATVRFTASDHTLGVDSLVHWRSVQRVASARIDLASWDHRSLSSRPVQSNVSDAVLSELAISDTPGAYAYEDTAQGERLAQRQAESLAAVQQRVLARGPWRRAAAGTQFTLTEHPRHTGLNSATDTFVILAAQHRARNNFSADARAKLVSLGTIWSSVAGASSTSNDDTPLHEAALLVQPLALPVRLMGGGEMNTSAAPGTSCAPLSLYDAQAVRQWGQPDVRLNTRPSIQGTQTALVVGSTGPVHTDRDGRIKVHFHWQRGAGASHRLMHPSADNAPGTDGAFTWVRVGQSSAGANHGAVFIPRVGQEVVVGFVGGDIDRPVVLGAAYNGAGSEDAQGNQLSAGAANATGNAPAWFAGTATATDALGQLRQGHQHAAVLLGFKSQELDSSTSGQGGYTQMVFDDTPQAARIELAASTLTSRLQLGALQHQQDNQRLAPRGHGMDLHSEGHGALRAGSGLLLSTESESASTGGGQQLQAREAINQLQSAIELVHTLAETAQAQQAKLSDEVAVQGAKATDTAKQLPTEQGLNALRTSLQTTDSRQGADSSGDSDSSSNSSSDDTGAEIAIDGGFGTVSAWGRPEVLLSAPSGIGLFSPAQAITHAGANITLSAEQDILSIAQGHHSTAAVKGAVLFTYGKATNTQKPNAETGIAIHAATGSLQASANTSTAEATASQSLEALSTQANVLISAPTSILLAAAGAAIDLQSSSITLKGPGSVQFKAGSKVWTSAGAASAPKNPHLAAGSLVLPDQYSARVDLYDFFVQHHFADVKYSAKLSDGRFMSGTLDKHGRTRQIYASDNKGLEILAGAKKPEWDLIFDYDDAGI